MHMAQERMKLFPNTYSKKVAIADTSFQQHVEGRFTNFKKRVKRSKYKWDDCVMEYIHGDDTKGWIGWDKVDIVYLPVNINKSHWILVEVCFNKWLFTVYDCDHSCTTESKILELLEPL